MAPNDQQITAAIEALRVDASTWIAAADVLRDAAHVGARQDLDAFHFSYLGDLVGVTDIYRQLQHKLVRLLGEAADNATALAGALRTAADGYEQDEHDAAHRMSGIY
jgi:hypothetical protein